MQRVLPAMLAACCAAQASSPDAGMPVAAIGQAAPGEANPPRSL
jgi:hypothetical protein